MRQLIIARKDLNMSPGKLAAQVAHGSLAYFMKLLRDHEANGHPVVDINGDSRGFYWIRGFEIEENLYENWINGIFTKTICEAKNKNQLMKAVTKAKELGLRENNDFFLIKDNCLTELEPEEIGEDGIGRTLTCIGFRPLPDDVTHEISKKYQLYKSDTNHMLDDMRAEITTLYSKYGDGSGWEESRNITLNEVIAIIDKYRKESGM